MTTREAKRLVETRDAHPFVATTRARLYFGNHEAVGRRRGERAQHLGDGLHAVSRHEVLVDEGGAGRRPARIAEMDVAQALAPVRAELGRCDSGLTRM